MKKTIHDEECCQTRNEPCGCPILDDDHSEHGRGDDSGPFDPDCICRESSLESECALAGCGFCKAAND